MSRLTDLASRATPQPWAAVPQRPHDTQMVITDDTLHLYIGIPSATGLDGVWNNPIENAALIVALVNRVDDIQRLWDAAERFDAMWGLPDDTAGTPFVAAIEALRDLLGGDDAEND